jgi:hypothetical protein
MDGLTAAALFRSTGAVGPRRYFSDTVEKEFQPSFPGTALTHFLEQAVIG